MRFAAIFVASLAISGTADASTPIFWQPPKMVAALKALQWPHQGILGGVCAGKSKPRHGAYSGFRCVLTWQTTGTSLQSGKVVVYARPLAAGRVCGSTRSLAACRRLASGPLAGDPTVCDSTDKAACALANTKLFLARHLGGPGGTFQSQLSCTLSGPLTFSCMAGPNAYTVTWARGASAWVATVAP